VQNGKNPQRDQDHRQEYGKTNSNRKYQNPSQHTTTQLTMVLQGCYKGVTRVLQGCYKGVTKVLQCCVTDLIRCCRPRPP
jgi:hypothetical protein